MAKFYEWMDRSLVLMKGKMDSCLSWMDGWKDELKHDGGREMNCGYTPLPQASGRPSKLLLLWYQEVPISVRQPPTPYPPGLPSTPPGLRALTYSHTNDTPHLFP